MVWDTGRVTREAVHNQIDNANRDLALKCTSLRLRSSAGDILASSITLDLLSLLREAKAAHEAAIAMPHMAEYVAAERRRPQDDIVSDFLAVLNEVNNTIVWIENAIPKSTDGTLAVETMSTDGSGTISAVSFTSVQTATLRPRLQAIEDLINVIV